jgi:hypothetical protein
LKGHTKKYVKKGMKLPKFKPLPTKLENMRNALRNYFATFKTYARFYGDYLDIFTRKRKRFSFQVFLDSTLTGGEKYEIVSSICNLILKNKIPLHEPGQIFSYHELLHHTHWTPVRRLLQYEVGMRYG